MPANRTRRYSSLRIRQLVAIAALCASTFSSAALHAEETSPRISISHTPRIAIVIDDLGHQLSAGQQAIALSQSGPITYAIIPFTPHGKPLAELAYKEKNEVILHIPMEPIGEYKPHPGMLTRTMSRTEFIDSARRSIEEIPFITGVNNHMGSLLTQHAKQMHWLMDELKLNTSLYFLDSLTSDKSVAYTTAKSRGLHTVKRDIFLDSEQSDVFVEQQLSKLQRLATEQGYAIGIGHPYPETLRVLRKRLPELKNLGYELVSLTDILQSPANLPYQYAVSGGNSSNKAASTIKDPQIFNHQLEHPREEAK